MPYSRRRDHRSLAGHASARPGVDIHSVGGDSASDASVVDDMERGAAVGGDSASDSSVVDDTERSAAAVAGDSEGSGIDLCVFLSPSTSITTGNPENAIAVHRQR